MLNPLANLRIRGASFESDLLLTKNQRQAQTLLYRGFGPVNGTIKGKYGDILVS